MQGDWKELRLGLEERDALDRILKRLHTENAFSSVKEEKETADASCVESRQFGKNPVTVETLNDQLLQTRNMDDFRQWLKDASDLLMERGTLPLETKKKELQLKRNMCNEMSKILENLKEHLQELGDKTNDAESLVESFLRDMGDTMEHYGYSTELLHVLSNHLSSLDFVQSTMQSLNQKHLNPFHSEFWQKWKDVENILRNIILSNAHVSETHELLVQSLELELELFDQVRYHFQSYMSRTCIETLEASHCIIQLFLHLLRRNTKRRIKLEVVI